MEGLKIFILASHPDSLIRFRRNLMAEMIGDGHLVFACAPSAKPDIQNQLSDMGVIYIDLSLNRTGTNPIADLHYLKSLIQILNDLKPDICLSYTIKPVIYGSIAAMMSRVKFASSMITGLGYAFSNDTIKQRAFSHLARVLYRFALRSNNVVFFQNPDDMQLFHTLGLLQNRTRAVLINGSGIDLESFSPRPFPPQISFLLIARLIQAKGIAEYAEAARLVRRTHPQAKFRLIGWIDDNPDAISRNDLDAWVRDGTIEYLGVQKDIRPAMEDTSVFVLPSYYREGIPRTILEALAMGRPVVTTDAPGCRETVVEGENGFLVPVRDAAALAAALERFFTHPELVPAMGRASRRMAERKFNVRDVNRIILNNLGLRMRTCDGGQTESFSPNT